MADSGNSISEVLFALAILATILNFVSVVLKLCKDFSTPKLWKYSLLYQDVACLFLCVGLTLFCVNIHIDVKYLCDATGFFVLFGIFQCVLSYLTTGVILLSIQNPGKPSSLSKFHRNVVILIITPEVILGAIVSFLPYVSNELFDTDVEFDVTCFPIRDHGNQGAAYGTLLVVLWWLILVAVGVCDVITILKLWKFNNRVNSAHNNVWQCQLISQGKSVVKLSLIEHIGFLLVVLGITISIYPEYIILEDNNTWIVMTSLAVSAIVHGVLSNISDVMFISCCCRDNSAVQEPHRKLKKLELLKIEAPGKLRMKATWTIGKHAMKRGLMKVYGVDHLKSWAQEIVMLGMLRRTQHPSLIQCLWTNSSNPYYETMTLISGDIITSDSRIICLELTNGGTLQDFLQKCELPLPEPCQRMIIHDIAEGLFYLHHESILHNNLTTSCIYLKGSLQSMVLRAAVGDFEDAQIYGTLQMSLDSSLRDKRYFFLPDIRSFSLIALEIVGKMCEKRFQNRYVNYNTESIPMKLNLENVISDEDEEFGAQYGYEAEYTHRMFDAIHQNEVDDSDEYESEASEGGFEIRRRPSGSLENLMDRNRPMSPDYHGRELRKSEPVCVNNKTRSDEEDEEVAAYNERARKVNEKVSIQSNANTIGNPRKCKSPEVSKTMDVGKVSVRKSRKDVSKSADNVQVKKKVVSTPPNRSLSPLHISKQTDIANRCVSPDPMKDEELQKLRNETSTNTKVGKKERKFSFNRKKSEENVLPKGKMSDAFVKTSKEQEAKRKDGSWLSKPTSILKSITSNDTTVSVFKAKLNDEENHLDAIAEEDIAPGQSTAVKPRQIQVKEKPKAEVWDIIDEQYYKQVNRKATNKLKKTVSSESKSSLWSFISTPDDMDDDDLDDILDSLPGMAEPSDFRNSEIKVSDILAERDRGVRKADTKKRFSLADLNKSKFELIDYYELLKSRQITMQDVPEDKREMLLNVVELKKEEKLKREGKFVQSSVIRNDEMYDDNMSPNGSNINGTSSPTGGKMKLVSFRQNQSHTTPHNVPLQSLRDPRLDRARSAPLKRPRTPMHKPSVEKTPEINPAFNDTRTITVAKRNKARAALKRALNNKNSQTYQRNDRDRERLQTPVSDMSTKYATIRKINANSDGSGDNTEQESSEVLTVPVPTSESFSVTNVNSNSNPKDVKRYASFSSNESASSIGSSVHQRRADVSLTSGELSSLSSQAESEHYETDGHITDIENVSKSVPHNMQSKPGRTSRVDSGFDSGSMSSEVSDAFINRAKQFNPKLPMNKNNKGVLNSWARNYKLVDSLPSSNSPYNFSNKFLPPTENPFKVDNNQIKQSERETYVREDSDKSSADSGYSQTAKPPKPEYRTENKSRNKKRTANGQELKSLNMSPYGPISSRPMSPPSRPMSPPSRSLSPSQHQMSSNSNSGTVSPESRTLSPEARALSPISLNSRPLSPSARPMSPSSRPMSPNVQPTQTRIRKHASRPMTPKARVLSPTRDMRQNRNSDQTFAPGRKLSKPPSSHPHQRAKSVDRGLHINSTGKVITQEDSKHRVRSLSPPVSIKSEPGSQSENAAKASKRYRELVKQGVPLRTSVVDAEQDKEQNRNEEIDTRPNTADSMIERPLNDQELFENLEAKGFFATRPNSRSPHKGSSPNRTKSPNTVTEKGQHQKRQKHKRRQIPLEELVREKPAGKSQPPAHRSPSKNHLAVSDEAFLNQPTSEDSETCSIKTNKSNGSTPSGSKPKVMVDAELVIDRIFSQNQPTDHELDVEVEAALGLDKDPFQAVNELYLNGRSPDPTDLDNMPLLNGMDDKHIHGVMELASGLHVITVRDLLPATQTSFEILRTKLQQVGQLGTVGNQLMDVIQRCWLLDIPPSSGDLVEQLTDPVTETEL